MKKYIATIHFCYLAVMGMVFIFGIFFSGFEIKDFLNAAVFVYCVVIINAFVAVGIERIVRKI